MSDTDNLHDDRPRELTSVEADTAFTALVEMAREDFETFCLMMYPPKNNPTNTDIQIGGVHRLMCSIVQGVADGRLRKRQAISVPPQHGKSTFITILAVAWIMGHRAGVSVGISAFSSTLVNKFSRDIKAMTQTPIYRLIFPDMTMGKDNVDNVDEREWDNGSCLQCKTTGKKFTGRRIDWKVIDDPHAGREEAESKVIRDRVLTWYNGDVVTRLAPGASVFLVMTRWHPEDLVGSLTDEEYVEALQELGQLDSVFETTNLKALSEGEGDDPLGRTEPDMALFPEVRGTPFLKAIKASIPSYEWQSQYQGRPVSSLGGQVDVTKFSYISMDTFRDIAGSTQMEMTRGWDLAVTEAQGSDFTAGAMIGYDRIANILYIVDIFRNKAAWVKNRQNIIVQTKDDAEQWGLEKIGIEAVSGFTALYQDIKQQLLGVTKVVKMNPGRRSKLLRAHPWLHLLEAGRVVLVRGEWNRAFVSELANFPDGKHDDMVDALSIARDTLLGPRVDGGKSQSTRSRRSVRRRRTQQH